MIRIWDNHNNRWLTPMSIDFRSDGTITRIAAKVPGADPLSDGWYDIDDKDLDKIAVTGCIEWNVDLLPETI